MKTTFKHAAPSGKVYKRQSAHEYTHVVLAKENIERQVAAIQAWDTDQARKERERDAREAYAHAMQVIRAGVGGRADYVRGQGGYGRPEGFQVDQWHVDHETEWLAKRGGSEAAFIEHWHREFRQHFEASLKSAREQSTEWFVLSWHHSAPLAMKAANTACRIRDTKVEAINGGARS